MEDLWRVQDSGIEHVIGFNIYLTPSDGTGRHRRFVRDGLEVDHVDVEYWDLAIAEPEAETMDSVYADEPTSGMKPARKPSGPTATLTASKRQQGYYTLYLKTSSKVGPSAAGRRPSSVGRGSPRPSSQRHSRSS